MRNCTFFTTIFFVGKNKIIKYSENWGGKRNRKTYLIGIAFLFFNLKKEKNTPKSTKTHQTKQNIINNKTNKPTHQKNPEENNSF